MLPSIRITSAIRFNKSLAVAILLLLSACQKGNASGGDDSATQVRDSVTPIDIACKAPNADWANLVKGVSYQGSEIPRRGISNSNLPAFQRAAKLPIDSIEQLGSRVSWQGYEFVKGKSSNFGGAGDSVVGPNEKGAITGEILRQLNVPLRPTNSQLKNSPEKFYYIAMRFDYKPNGRKFWKDQKLLLLNPRNGKAVVVRPVDWGPSTIVGRIIDMSPQAEKDLSMRTDQEVLVTFADPSTKLGPIDLCN